ncbi:hypothetical protein DPMN_058576 [Dreissena polymorpha]|uniref:Uncharacterized protein n=1 Tax=Dreissena polymorpha TaxID=45954 RepID=A0A9D4HDW0_DREPO|nr:hypothetical protein DPMN_058576 [Dreissena polymorpha]
MIQKISLQVCCLLLRVIHPRVGMTALSHFPSSFSSDCLNADLPPCALENSLAQRVEPVNSFKPSPLSSFEGCK